MLFFLIFFGLIIYSVVSHWSTSSDKEQVISPNVCFKDKWLAKSQLDMTLLIGDWLGRGRSSQRIIITDDQSKNTMTSALSAKGVDTR